MKKKLTISLIMILILAVSGLSWAGNRHGGMDGHHNGKGGGPMKILKKLDLTQQQQGDVKTIMDKYQSEKQTLRENTKNAKKALHETIHADTFNEQAIRSASKTLSDAMEEMAVFRGKIFAEIRPLLTPEQIDRLAEMPDRHHKRMKCKEIMKD